MTVELEHPKLPGRIIRVAESGVAQRAKAGWRPVKRRRTPAGGPVETPEAKPDTETA